MKGIREEVLREAMRGAKAASMTEARLEPAELVWWRAQLRKRQTALAKVSGPIRGVQTFTAALMLCAAVAMVAVGWDGEWLKAFAFLVSAAGLAGLAMVIVLTGVVVYLTVERE
jgi:hypothetical protein